MSTNKPDRERLNKEAAAADVKIKFSPSGGSVQVGGPGGSVYSTAADASKKIKGNNNS